MSIHIFDTRYQDRDAQVTLGYDRPLGHVFLTVLAFASSNAESESAAEDAKSEAAVDNSADEHDDDDELDDDDDELDDEDDGVVYSSEADFGQGLDYYRAKLTDLGITVPESMFRETEQDFINCAGNRVVRHHEDGRLETLQDG